MAIRLLYFTLALFFFLRSATPVAAREPVGNLRIFEKNPLQLEEARPLLQEVFNNLTSMADGSASQSYSSFCSIVYESCVSNPAESPARFEDSEISHSLEQDGDEDFVERWWLNYEIVTRWFSWLLHFLGRFYLPKNNLLSPEQAGHSCPLDKICVKLNDRFTSATPAMFMNTQYMVKMKNIDYNRPKYHLNWIKVNSNKRVTQLIEVVQVEET